MSAARIVSLAVALVLAACGVVAASLGIPAILGYLADPDGFLTGLAGMLRGFLVFVGIVAGVTAWSVLRETRWAWQAAVLATALMLLTGVRGLSDPRPPGSLPLVELVLAFGGVVLAGLLLARWSLGRQDREPTG